MMTTRGRPQARLMALSVMLALGVVGCGTGGGPPATPGPGQPAPAPARPGPVLPPRPAVLPLDKVDNPCALLTDAQVRQLGVEPGQSQVNADEMPGPDCLWSNFPARPDRGWVAQPLPYRGAEYALGSTTGAQVVRVGAFSAVQTSSALVEPRFNCILFVDTGPGQSLLVQFSNVMADDPTMTHARACQYAITGATMMIQNLRTLAR
jgi:uncharacterized protein DUF3558